MIRHAAEPWRPEHSLAIGRLEAWDLRTTGDELELGSVAAQLGPDRAAQLAPTYPDTAPTIDRKSTRLNSSHLVISYAVFCLKKKKAYGAVRCTPPYDHNVYTT